MSAGRTEWGGTGLLQAGGGYEAEGDGFHDHVGSVGGPELAHDVAAVGLDGILGDVEDGCDLAGVLGGGSIRSRFCCLRWSVTTVVVRERSVTAAAVRYVFVLGMVQGISACGRQQRPRAPAGRSGPAARS